MGFYIRKAFSFGLLRLNASKSGLGVSAGVRGARVGVKPNGQQYVHVGRAGLYYRENVGGAPRAGGIAPLPEVEAIKLKGSELTTRLNNLIAEGDALRRQNAAHGPSEASLERLSQVIEAIESTTDEVEQVRARVQQISAPSRGNRVAPAKVRSKEYRRALLAEAAAIRPRAAELNIQHHALVSEAARIQAQVIAGDRSDQLFERMRQVTELLGGVSEEAAQINARLEQINYGLRPRIGRMFGIAMLILFGICLLAALPMFFH